MTTFSIGITTDGKHALGGRMLWVVACCSNDLAAAHYRLAYSVLMVGLRRTTEPYHIFHWYYNRVKARSGWSHALGERTLF